MWIELAAGALGLAGGVLAGLYGVGGGVLFVPTLSLVLGLSQLHAEATSLLAILPTAAAGVWNQRRYGNLSVRPAIVIGLAAIGGVEGGVQLAKALSDAALRRIFGVLMIVVAAQLVWRALRRPYPS